MLAVMHLRANGRVLDLTQPQVMAIVNITPDSFSDGGRFFSADVLSPSALSSNLFSERSGSVNAVVDHALQLVEQGATIIDLGGESTRPGAVSITVAQELDRVMPVLECLRKNTQAWLSIDTSKPEVMRAAAAAGVDLINDVNALQADTALEVVAAVNLPVCLMHRQGSAQTMQQAPHYQQVVSEVSAFLEQRLQVCEQAGLSRSNCVVDPGIGFGKSVAHNLSLLKHLQSFQTLKAPILVGASRKSFIGNLLQRPVEQRLAGGLSVAVWCVLQGANIIRTHDVPETVDALRMLHELRTVQD